MDEIVIDERKYISSKRAAKLTGYAKDYVGQLCREGRVQARLVGRSWYVLESAIQDHRFGNQKEKSEISSIKNGASDRGSEPTKIVEGIVEPVTWNLPRYKVTTAEDVLLPIVREKIPESRETIHQPQEEFSTQEPREIEQIWNNWLDPQDNTITPVMPLDQEELKDGAHEGVIREDEPILVHRYADRGMPERVAESRKNGQSYQGLVYRLFWASSVLIAVIFLSLSLISRGFFDDYIASLRQVSVISGINLYTKHNK